MAKIEISDYDETDSGNTDISGIGLSDATLIDQLDNIARAQMGALKRWFRSNLFRLRDSTDQTKLLAFDLSGLPTGTTRTLTAPDKNGTVALTGDVPVKNDINRNLWVNGSFAVSQENGNTLGTTNGYHPADQIGLYYVAAAAAMSVQRIQARTLANATDQIEFKTTTAKPTLSATDYVSLAQPIEGSAFAASGFGTPNAKPLVMRFQVTLPQGLYHCYFQNSAKDRHCSVPFTITAGQANTPVVKEIAVPADTSGTWLTGDGVIGITCDLVLAAGPGKTGGAPSAWSGTAFIAASTQKNILDSTANVARVADVGLKLDATGAGVYGAYRINEVDAVYWSGRYALEIQTGFLGTATATAAYGSPVSYVMSKAPTFSLIQSIAATGFPSTIGVAAGSTLTNRGFTYIKVATATASNQTFSDRLLLLARLS